MVTNQDVLEYLEELEGSLTASALSNRFRISVTAALRHLTVLWREQLVETSRARPRGYRFRLRSDERLEQLAFVLSDRGRRRLAYYRTQASSGESRFSE